LRRGTAEAFDFRLEHVPDLVLLIRCQRDVAEFEEAKLETRDTGYPG
jgi:hypothetical protein